MLNNKFRYEKDLFWRKIRPSRAKSDKYDSTSVFLVGYEIGSERQIRGYQKSLAVGNPSILVKSAKIVKKSTLFDGLSITSKRRIFGEPSPRDSSPLKRK